MTRPSHLVARIRLASAAPALLLFLSACTGEVDGGGTHGSGAATGAGASVGAGAVGGAGPSAGGSAGSTAASGGMGVGGAGAVGAGGSLSGAGGSLSGAGGGSAGAPIIPAQCADQAAVTPGRAPVRRLTRYEYNNTVRDLLRDDTNPASAFPSELSGNGFGNDADQQPVSSILAEQYGKVAEQIAAKATGTSAALSALAPCAASVTAANQATCARTIIDALLPKAYRRPLVAGEADEYVALFTSVATANNFASGVAAVIEAVLQSPDFLYRVEFGAPDPMNAALKRPTGAEMATRLSYFLWGTEPDALLTTAAGNGELGAAAGVMTQAQRLLADPKARTIVRYFFDNLLPLSNITDLSRDAVQYPTFTPAIGGLMQQETHAFLDYEVFDGGGTWPSVLTAPYTFVNQTLATYYGMTGVQGNTFQKVPLDTTQRLGLLTQGAMMVGTTPSNHTNPVLRGSFIVRNLMCRDIQLPTDPAILALVTTPDPYSGATARDRFTQHRANPVCSGCHVQMDPMGLALENYDAVGLYRTMENMVMIDATGEVPDMPDGAVNGPIQLAQKLAANEEVQNCFASKWLDFAYGQTLKAESPADVCSREALAASFRQSNFNIKQMLLDLTQTDGFLYLGSQQ